MTTILLIRHGHTAWIGNAIAGHTPGVGLDETGYDQARRLPERLKKTPIQAIYSSPLQRTLETAEPLAQALGLRVEPRLRLIEVDFGEWTGATMQELERDSRWRSFNELRSITRAPGGEQMLEVQARMVAELESIRVQHREETVAVFSHQDSIKGALAHYAGIPLDLFHRFEIGPASISAITLADCGPRIMYINANSEY